MNCLTELTFPGMEPAAARADILKTVDTDLSHVIGRDGHLDQSRTRYLSLQGHQTK